MTPRVDPIEAAIVMRAAGVNPLVDYPGARIKWHCKCISCGAEVYPLYSTVSRGLGGCEECAKRATAQNQRQKGLEKALQTLESAGFELQGNYLNARIPVQTKCLSCGQIQKRTVDSIKQGQKCHCKRLPRKPLFEFRPDLAAQLHPELNGKRDGTNIGTGERENVWWLCPRGHEYEATPANRIHERNDSCPFCSGRKALSGQTDLISEHPELAIQLAAKQPNDLDPRLLRSQTNKKLGWKCMAHPDHYWEAAPSERLRGYGCPICDGKQILRGFNDLETKFPQVASEWHPTKNGSLLPSEVAPRTNKAVWWLCSENHVWKASISPRALGVGCPRCSKAGFDSTKTGIFYFIEHPEFLAMKVGITNRDSRKNRLAKFRAAGWKVISLVEREEGRKILELETAILRWIRKELNLSAFLGAEDMATTGGHSETFGSDGVQTISVLEKIEEVISKIDLDFMSSNLRD